MIVPHNKTCYSIGDVVNGYYLSKTNKNATRPLFFCLDGLTATAFILIIYWGINTLLFLLIN